MRYCHQLEEGSFRGKPADFLILLLFAASAIILCAALLPTHQLVFLSSPMTYALVYIWARRNPFVRMNLLGVLNFQAPFLPWILVAFGTLLQGLPISDLVGIAVGHLYWYAEDIYPRLVDANNRPRRRIFAPPNFLLDFCGQPRPAT